MNDSKSAKGAKTKPFQETVPVDGTGTRPEGEAAELVVGESFGRYTLEKQLGEGAMGAVYLAHDQSLNRKVALKIPKFGKAVDDPAIQRFYQEARSAATLSHPNICPIYDVGELNGTHFIAMGFVQGRPLSDFVNADRPQPQRTIALIVRKIAMALQEAHDHGVVHRDLKPANIMIDQRQEPIVMDFGLARRVDQEQDARLTQEGSILGSPAYMSPEQLKGNQEEIGPASDVYSLGVLCFELLTGELPFQGSGTVMSIIGEIFASDPPAATSRSERIDASLSAICQQAMAKLPDDRFSSMKEFADALTQYLKPGASTVQTIASAAQVAPTVPLKSMAKPSWSTTPSPKSPTLVERYRLPIILGAVAAGVLAIGILGVGLISMFLMSKQDGSVAEIESAPVQRDDSVSSTSPLVIPDGSGPPIPGPQPNLPGPSPQSPVANPNAVAKARTDLLLAELDGDGDGQLVASEVPQRDTLRVALANSNRDGTVTRDELIEFFERVESDEPWMQKIDGMVDRLMELDSDGDGAIDRSEATAMLQHLHRGADINQDMKLDRSEISTMVREAIRQGIGRGERPGRGQGPQRGGFPARGNGPRGGGFRGNGAGQ